MLKSIVFVVMALLMSGCLPNPAEVAQPKQKEEKVEKYREFSNYNRDVLPLLEKGYVVVKEVKLHQPRNITPEQFIAKIGTSGYRGAEFVMVQTHIANGYYDFHAIYLRKLKTDKMVLGAQLQSEMPMQIREEFGSNKGCALGKIYYNTPAYRYDLHENDIVTFVNGEEVLSCSHLKTLLKENNVVDFKVWADGQTIDVDGIVLNK